MLVSYVRTEEVHELEEGYESDTRHSEKSQSCTGSSRTGSSDAESPDKKCDVDTSAGSREGSAEQYTSEGEASEADSPESPEDSSEEGATVSDDFFDLEGYISPSWLDRPCPVSKVSSHTSAMYLDLPRDAHILAGIGPWTHLVMPVVCIADEGSILPILSSVLSQRHVWGIELPVVGVEVSPYASIGRVYIAWRQPVTHDSNGVSVTPIYRHILANQDVDRAPSIFYGLRIVEQ